MLKRILNAVGGLWKAQSPPKKDLPPVRLHLVHEHTNGFVSPRPTRSVQCRKADDVTVVGHISYGVSPLDDRIYIGEIEVHPEHRLQGYASSMLLAVVTQNAVDGKHLAVTGMSETEMAAGFWTRLRQGGVSGLVVTKDIDVHEQVPESARWAHLKPTPPWQK